MSVDPRSSLVVHNHLRDGRPVRGREMVPSVPAVDEGAQADWKRRPPQAEGACHGENQSRHC